MDVYPTRADAERAKGARGTVVEALGKVWLLTIEKAGWRPTVKGVRIAEIGPLPVKAGEEYSAVFMEAISTPGMTSAIHTHSGPEAWYAQAGETCLETPNGKQVGRPGGPPVIVPGGPPMLLTTTGTETRRAYAYPARIVEAADNRGSRLDAEGFVQLTVVMGWFSESLLQRRVSPSTFPSLLV